jgi:hypothetical protein
LYLGIGEDGVQALVEAGLLLTGEPSLLDGQQVWIFTQKHLDAMLQSILDDVPYCLIPDTDNDDALRFEQIVRLVSWSGIRLPRLLRDIQRARLDVFRDQHNLHLSVLWGTRSAILAYIEQYCQPDDRILWSMQRVCDSLRCKPVTLRRLCAAGLLVPCQGHDEEVERHWQYDPADVESFLDRYVDSTGAADILGMTRITVQKWARSGQLPAVTGPEIDGSHTYRFEKDKLIQWRHERLTCGEAKTLLGISRATLHRWIEKGKLQPLDGMSGKQRWFARGDVEGLL